MKALIQSHIRDPIFFSHRLAQGSQFAIQELLSQLSGWDGSHCSLQGKRLMRMMTPELFERFRLDHEAIHQEKQRLTWSVDSVGEMDPNYLIKQVYGPKKQVKHTFIFDDIPSHDSDFGTKSLNDYYIHKIDNREFITQNEQMQPLLLDVEGFKVGIDLEIPVCLTWSLADLNGERKGPFQLRLESNYLIHGESNHIQWRIAELDFCRRK
jgi:hypothetical protein